MTVASYDTSFEAGFAEGTQAIADRPQLLAVGQRSWRMFVMSGDLMVQEALSCMNEQPFSIAADPELSEPLVEYNVADWQRWITEADCSSIRWRPMLPDKPLVVRPSSQLTLSPRAGGHLSESTAICAGWRLGLGRRGVFGHHHRADE